MLRQKHDMFIVKTALDDGIHMLPERWSQTLYGDHAHKSQMQSVVDRVQILTSVERQIDELYEKLRSISPELFDAFDRVRHDFDYIAGINFEKRRPKTDYSICDGN